MIPGELEQATQRYEVVLAGIVVGSAARAPEVDLEDFHRQLDKLEADLAAVGISRNIMQQALVEATRRISARTLEPEERDEIEMILDRVISAATDTTT